MKPIKMLGLAMIAALAMAFAGAGSALAEETVLCSADEKECAAGNIIPHTHLVDTKVKLSGLYGDAYCTVLFLGTVLPGNKLKKHGKHTYSKCYKIYSGKEEACTVEEVSEESIIELLRMGHETASAVGEGEFNVHCGFSINCTYNWEGLEGTAKGPLLSSEANGELSIQEQELNKVSGILCPSTTKLTLVSIPLSATYITS